MGYTHYWRREKELNKDKFKAASADCKKIADWLKAPIQFEWNNPEPPVFDDTIIRFNGIEDDGHETFLVTQDYKHPFLKSNQPDEDGRYFTFCKTARKPYDTAVTACLIILKHHFGDDIKVSSDGRNSEWREGVNAVKTCLGYGEVPFNSTQD